MVLNLKPALFPHQVVIAETILDLLPFIKTIYVHSGGIRGQFREPSQMHYVAGEKKSVVRHVENRVIFEFDIEKIMFSKGNIYERRYLPKLVQSRETIVDMFAGIGYFSLPIAIHANPTCIYAIEINPVAYEFLVKNISLNHVEQLVHPILGDRAIIVHDFGGKRRGSGPHYNGGFPGLRRYTFLRHFNW